MELIDYKNKEAHEKCEILYSLYKEHKTLCFAWIDCQFIEIKRNSIIVNFHLSSWIDSNSD